MRHTTVLFDLDGTLVDSIELIVQAAQHAFSSRPGPRPTRPEIMASIGKPLVVQFGAYARSDEELQGYVTAYREYQLEHHDALLRPYDGVAEVVRRLQRQDRSLGVVTSKVEFLAHRALSHVGLDGCFSLVVGVESTTRHKPDPEPLLFALDRLGAVAGDAVYVGDSPFDIQAANAAGVTSVGVTWGAFDAATLQASGPDHLVERPAALMELLDA